MMGSPWRADSERVFDLRLPPLRLESGATIDAHRVRGWIAGAAADLEALDRSGLALHPDEAARQSYRVVRRLALPAPPAPVVGLDAGKPTLLLVHALTGDMRAGGPGGWWEPLLGPGRALDTNRWRIVCFNNLGGCYGSSGPADADYPRDERRRPAPVTPWDQARSLLLALDRLGIDQVDAVLGGSLGGTIALCLAALAPERVRKVVPIAACEASSAWILGWNHVARQLLTSFDGDRGLELARQLAMLTYRAEPGLHDRQGRRPAEGAEWSPGGTYAIGAYLEHQGRKLRARFDREAYLLQLGAMDHHDLGRAPGPPGPDERWRHGDTWGLARVTSPVFAVDVDTDALYLPAQTTAMLDGLRALGTPVGHATIRSPHGHDAFLIEWAQLTDILARALAWAPPEVP